MELEQPMPVKFEDVLTVYDNSTVHCAVITDSEHKVLYASQSLADALGYTLQEIQGKPFYIFPTSDAEPLLPNGINTIAAAPSKKGYIIQKNGAKAMVDYESMPIQASNNREYLFSRIANLEAYLLYNRLTETSNSLENILNNLNDSIVLITPDLTILKTNSTFLKTFELAEELLQESQLKNLNSSFWKNELIHGHLTNKYIQELYDFDAEFDWEKQLGENKNFKFVSRLIHKSDSTDDSKILLVITDVTQEKANQTGRNQQIRHIMHELRNPLSNLSLCVELLADSTKENNQEESALFLAKAGNSIQRMKQLINDLNDFKSSPAK